MQACLSNLVAVPAARPNGPAAAWASYSSKVQNLSPKVPRIVVVAYAASLLSALTLLPRNAAWISWKASLLENSGVSHLL